MSVTLEQMRTIDGIVADVEKLAMKVCSVHSNFKKQLVEPDLLTAFEKAEMFMKQILRTGANDRTPLVQIFGGDCFRIVRLEGVLKSIAFTNMWKSDDRHSRCKEACQAVIQVLEDLGNGAAIQAARDADDSKWKKDHRLKNMVKALQRMGALTPAAAGSTVVPSKAELVKGHEAAGASLSSFTRLSVGKDEEGPDGMPADEYDAIKSLDSDGVVKLLAHVEDGSEAMHALMGVAADDGEEESSLVSADSQAILGTRDDCASKRFVVVFDLSLGASSAADIDKLVITAGGRQIKPAMIMDVDECEDHQDKVVAGKLAPKVAAKVSKLLTAA